MSINLASANPHNFRLPTNGRPSAELGFYFSFESVHARSRQEAQRRLLRAHDAADGPMHFANFSLDPVRGGIAAGPRSFHVENLAYGRNEDKLIRGTGLMIAQRDVPDAARFLPLKMG